MGFAEFNRRLKKIAKEKGVPLYGGFELTSRCNLNCKMCYVKGPGEKERELTARQWAELARGARDCGTLTIYLTGGEPLIREDFKEIYESICRLGLRINLFTNGTLITEDLAKWLSQIPPATIDISLYGASAATYKSLCGNGEAYQRTINALELLLKYNIFTRIKTTIVKTNIHDYQGIQKIAASYGLELISTNIIHGNRTTGIKNIAEERLTPEEIYTFSQENLGQYDYTCEIIEKIRVHFKNLPAMACSAGKCSFFVNWLGYLVPCALFEKPYTEPLVSGFKPAWDILCNEVMKIPGLEICRECESRAFCPVCPGRLYLETGRFDGYSEYVCQIAKVKEQLVRIN